MRIRSPATATTGTARAVLDVTLAIVPALLLATMLSNVVIGWKTTPQIPLDFHSFWRDGSRYLHGRSPYPASFAHTSVYPAPVAAMFAPFALIHFHTAASIFLALSTAAVAASLWLFDIRDWRCYAATFLTPTVLTAITVGTLTPLLLLGLAATWRLRRRRSVVFPIALLIVGKLIFWPFLLWLVIIGRRRAAAEAVLLTIAVVLVGWAPIGFAGLTRYPTILGRLGSGYGPESYALPTLVGGGRAADAAVAGATALLLWRARRLEEHQLFALVVLATLACSPIVWLHYFAFLIAVAAVLQPRLGAPWMIPSLFWVTPQQMINGERWRLAAAIAICALMALMVLLRTPRAQLPAPAGLPAARP
jgi:hypothetical protein